MPTKISEKVASLIFYTRLVAVQIVAIRLAFGATSIAAALLHDVVEDTSLILDDIIHVW